jgi:phosphoglycerol transferase MdoB-like AlkP superfamily enzyme
MKEIVPSVPWTRSRYGFALFHLLALVFGWTIVRVILLAAFSPAGLPATDVAAAFASGFVRDVTAALFETLPLLFWMAVATNRLFLQSRLHRALFWAAALLTVYVQIFLLCVEGFFFEEFKSRFNTVAVDYLIYPKEVAVNIWESYHVGWILFGVLLLSIGILFAASRLFRGMWLRPFPARIRWAYLAGAALAAFALALTVNLKSVHVGPERTLNEIANNGPLSFVMAAWTRNLDYAAFYKTLPREEAYQRTRRLLAAPEAQFDQDPLSIRRRITGDTNRPRLNVVILLEESLGSEFWGCLGRANTLTPEMDRLAERDGMLFTNIYACGNRTVRGMEGVLSSFPPLPGDSIVKRDRSDNVETIARVLRRDGYSTLFLYGGRGVFDGMRSYTVRNGYERFIEQKHFPKPTFTTIWGVCDEDLFARAIEECRELAKTGKPFFATALSVSNHKPYTYPAGRIPEDPAEQRRTFAVKYSDYCLGQFFQKARQEPFWTNTIFVVVADHGARVYGSQSIPIHSYEIPVLIAGPAVVKSPSRIGQLGNSLDVSPTILGLLGRPYDTLFFGRDLLKSEPAQGRALLNHNRDIGMLSASRLVVLGLMQTSEFYQGDPKRVNMAPLTSATDADLQLERDATAIFQVADELYTHRLYRLDMESSPAKPMH